MPKKKIYLTLDVSRTASYEITLVCLSVGLSIRAPVSKFSHDIDIVHEDR